MRQIRTCLFTCAIAAHLAGGAHAAAEFPAADDRWIRIDTTNFTLFSNTTQGATLRIARDLEKFRTVLRMFYGKLPERAAVPSFVYVFKSDPSYTPYKPLYDGKPMDVAGYFQQHRDGNYITLTTHSGINPYRVIYHEFMHYLLDNYFPRVPVWFNEGLAEYYSTFEADDDSASIGKPIGEHVITLRRRPFMPLQELLAVTRDSPVYNEGDRRGIFYAESWALVHYLMWGSVEGKSQLGDYLGRLGRGEDPDAAFRASFGVSTEKLEGELRMYLGQSVFSHKRVEFTKREFTTGEETRTLTKDEVLYHLGDLLAHMYDRREEEAERYFAGALALNPDQALAHSGIGLLAAGRDRHDEAIRHCERALQLDPDDDMISYRAASAYLQRRGPGTQDPAAPGGRGPSDLERARELFSRTILLNPDLAEAYVGYGEAIVYGGGEIAPAIKLLQAGWHLLPARTDLVVNLAVLYERSGEREKARYLVREVLPAMGDPRAERMARQLIPALDEPEPSGTRGTAAPPASSPDTVDSQPTGPRVLTDLDPETIRALEESREREMNDRLYNEQVEEYNRAVDLANAGDLSSAIGLLEALLPQIKSEELAEQTRSLLERMKRDFARLKRP